MACVSHMALVIGIVLASGSIGMGEEPARKGEDAPLARYFPREDLIALGEFEGFNVHGDDWRKTSTYRILNETTAGPMLQHLASQAVDRILGGSARGKGGAGSDVIAIVEHAFRSGFAFGFSGRAGATKPACAVMVVRGGGREGIRPALERLIDARNAAYGTAPETVKKPGSRQVSQMVDAGGTGYAWWFEGEDFVVSLLSAGGADDIIEVLEAKRPNAVAHPVRSSLVKENTPFTPIGWAFFDVSAIPAWSPKAAALGLDTIRRVESSWGFEGEALMSRVRLMAPAPRTGAVALFDQPSFDLKGISHWSPGLDGFLAASIKPASVLELLSELAESLNANERASFDAIFEKVEKTTGRKLKEEILAPLGPRFLLSSVPSKVSAPSNALSGLALGLMNVPRATLMIEVDDPVAYGKVLDDVVKGINQIFTTHNGGGEGEEPKLQIRPLPGSEKGYRVSVWPTLFPLPAGVRPTLMLGKRHLVVATTPDAARAALALEGQSGGPPSGDPLAVGLGKCPKTMTMFWVRNDRSSLLAELTANLPVLTQIVDLRRFTGIFAPNAPFQMMARGRVAVRAQPVRSGPKGVVAVDPDLIPAPDDLRPFLFPAWYSVSANDEGIEFLSREAFPLFNPAVTWPIALAVALPARQASLVAGLRAKSVNNLKQIGLALHNFHAANESLPPVASRNNDGKPLLSWRVAILPYIGQGPLYNEFHLDEPWDSPHNKPLIARMPSTFALPGAKTPVGTTYYRTYSGVGTLFDPTPKEGVSFTGVTDGTSNTIAVVEAREAVPWTKPDAEMAFDGENPLNFIQAKPLTQLGGHFSGGFNALFADGSVKFLKETINLITLRALVTRGGGEVISNDAY